MIVIVALNFFRRQSTRKLGIVTTVFRLLFKVTISGNAVQAISDVFIDIIIDIFYNVYKKFKKKMKLVFRTKIVTTLNDILMKGNSVLEK